MNRLIIVGNGFDLAHGLKTSYCDFITDYIHHKLLEFKTKRISNDVLLSIQHTSNSEYIIPSLHNISPDTSISTITEMRALSYYKVIFHSKMLHHTLQSTIDFNWVDIENEYFRLLVKYSDPWTSNSRKEISSLNEQLTFLKRQLEKYLTKETGKLTDINFSEKIKSVFRSEIRNSRNWHDRGILQFPTNITYLNFNYTDTLKMYLQDAFLVNRGGHIEEVNQTINHIHGELNSSDNPIVFGFGDEHDEKYLTFENLNDNSLFTHIKSFSYLQTNNYLNLTRYLALDEFQVFIVGHSCGLSDRTMFRMVVEHPNCNSVQIFYHHRVDGTDDFTEKTFDLSRHFRNKVEMREKIVPKPNSIPLPQAKTLVRDN